MKRFLLLIVMITVTFVYAYMMSLAREDYKPAQIHESIVIEETPPVAQIEAPQQPIEPIIVPEPIPGPTPVVEPVHVAPPSGSCAEWMAQAGIPQTAATTKLILNESGCRPDAVNPSSGACGIPQALPCSKLPCTLQDPVCQLQWMNGYVTARYTTWENALSFWYCIGTCYSNYGPVYKTQNWY